MANVLDPSSYPTREPEVITSGMSLQWRRADIVSDFPVASYNLSYRANFKGTEFFTIAATESSSPEEYRISVGADVTATYTPGRYNWAGYVVDAGDATKVVQISYGTWDVLADPAASTTDNRTHNEIMLDAIEATMEERPLDQASYSVAGRSLSRVSHDELLRLQAIYTGRVRREHWLQRMQAGEDTGKTIDIRFKRA